MGRPLKYGEANSVWKTPLTTGTVFKNLSGHYVYPNAADGKIGIATAAITGIIGWAEQAERTSVAGDYADVETDIFSKVFEIPAILHAGTAPTEAQLIAAIGETCDIIMVSTNYQYADVNTSAVDILIIVGYAYYGSAVGMQSVFVKINPEKVTPATYGVA